MTMNNKPYTTMEYIEKLSIINPDVEVLGEYVSSHYRIFVRCRKCGKTWSPMAYQLLQGRGCPECGKQLAVSNRRGKTAKKTTEQFINELSEVHQSITVIGEYKGNRNKIDCLCNVCGYKWAGNPYWLIKGAGCPNCFKDKQKKNRRYTTETFKEKLSKINQDVEILSSFTKSTEPIQTRCKRCGNIWFPKAYSLLQGRGCPNCSHIIGAKNNTGKTGLKSLSRFLKELSEVDESIRVIGKYINTHTDIECQCNRCNHIWKAKPYALLQGHGCPRCAKSGTSFMEQLILLCFQSVLGEEAVLSRDKSLISMELDIYIPKLQLAIEPGNWYLHKKSLKRDEKKRICCSQVGVRLITIYDRYPSKDAPPFANNCYVFSEDLNNTDHTVIHSLIYELFAECGIDKCFSDDEWEQLENAAYDNSKSITHEEFVKKLFEIRPDIEVIGKYENANRRIKVRCKKCGFIWDGVPANMLSGDGCRKCGARLRADKERRKQEDFEKELTELIPTIRVISTYISRHKPISVQCLRCGNVWETTPGSLLRKDRQNKSENNGCPNCAKARRGIPRKRVMNTDTGEIFESAVEAGKKYNTVPSSIRQCCRGVNKSSNGYHWKYLDTTAD